MREELLALPAEELVHISGRGVGSQSQDMVLDQGQIHAIRILDDKPGLQPVLGCSCRREDGVLHLDYMAFTSLTGVDFPVRVANREDEFISRRTEPIDGSVVVLIDAWHNLRHSVNSESLGVSKHDTPFEVIIVAGLRAIQVCQAASS